MESHHLRGSPVETPELDVRYPAPPDSGFNILAWWLPIVGLLSGVLAVGYLVWRWSRGRRGPPSEPMLMRLEQLPHDESK